MRFALSGQATQTAVLKPHRSSNSHWRSRSLEPIGKRLRIKGQWLTAERCHRQTVGLNQLRPLVSLQATEGVVAASRKSKRFWIWVGVAGIIVLGTAGVGGGRLGARAPCHLKQ